MPLKQCMEGGKKGWKWGGRGKCYTGPGAKAKAAKQALTIIAGGYEVTPAERRELFRIAKGGK